ncbi:hypothetical protein BDR04DRAFT_1149618 [Suillus decipiens]|nr:hypothetical protein BDR04DRAFT_1149618 [Suillus decipiens]
MSTSKLTALSQINPLLDNGVFAINCLSDSKSIPALLSTESLDEDADERSNLTISDEDWFSEVGKDNLPLPSDWETIPSPQSSGSDTYPFTELDIPDELTAGVSNGHKKEGHATEFYDSGSMCHISPYKELFESLLPIFPKLFTAANKQSLNAIGVGEMVIEVLNGVDVLKLCLTKVLYSLEVGYTLVSVGCLDKLSYSITFADGTCAIHDQAEDIVGQIPKSHWGLYCVVHEQESMNSATKTITIMELHKWMGHITPSVV